MTDKTTIDVYNARATDYIKLTATSKPDAALQGFIDSLPMGAFVLDLGCGPAQASAHMRAAGLRPDPIDASQSMVDLANDTYDIGARLGTFDDITGQDLYEGVWANFSLLHADPESLPKNIAALATVLKPEGVFHIGMKVGAGQSRDSIDRLYTYVGVQELRDMFENNGLTIVHTSEGEEAGLSGDVSPFVLMRAIKNG